MKGVNHSSLSPPCPASGFVYWSLVPHPLLASIVPAAPVLVVQWLWTLLIWAHVSSVDFISASLSAGHGSRRLSASLRSHMAVRVRELGGLVRDVFTMRWGSLPPSLCWVSPEGPLPGRGLCCVCLGWRVARHPLMLSETGVDYALLHVIPGSHFPGAGSGLRLGTLGWLCLVLGRVAPAESHDRRY